MKKKLSFFNSSNFYKKSIRLIPNGSQTFSKSVFQYPINHSPLYAIKSKKNYIWDVDGNKFFDLVSSLGAIILGYSDSGFKKAIRKQLNRGTIFSLPGILEFEVSELISEMIPSAEMIRFGKNSSDATSASIRLARFITGKSHVITCGYHGWQDWSIGTTIKNFGVPVETQMLSHAVDYGDLEKILKIVSNFQVACIILEPFNRFLPNTMFLNQLRSICTSKNIILIFDETLTGLRIPKYSAQALINVIPDLSIFGKALANGLPLSALVGKKDFMKSFDKVFFSTTFGGELLSLSAAKYTLTKIKNSSVINNINDLGKLFLSNYHKNCPTNIKQEILDFSGHESWPFFNWKVSNSKMDIVKNYFLQEILQRRTLVLNSHNYTNTMTDKEIIKLTDNYVDILANLIKYLNDDSLESRLKFPPLKPIFAIR